MIRLLVPGLCATIIYLSLIQPKSFSIQEFFDSFDFGKGFAFLSALLVGWIYHLFPIGKRLTAPYWNRTNGYIEQQLLQLAAPDQRVEDLRNEDRSAIRQFFWQMIDNDQSLTKRSFDIRINGTVLTSLSDLIVFLYLGAVAHGLAFVFRAEEVKGAHIMWCLSMVAVTFTLVMILIPEGFQFLIKRHMELMDEQFAYIRANKAEEVREFIEGRVQRL